MVENPFRSYLWGLPAFKKLAADPTVRLVRCDSCMQGSLQFKPTGFLTNLPEAERLLGLQCQGGRSGPCTRTGVYHEGWDPIWDESLVRSSGRRGGWIYPSAGEAEYPGNWRHESPIVSRPSSTPTRLRAASTSSRSSSAARTPPRRRRSRRDYKNMQSVLLTFILRMRGPPPVWPSGQVYAGPRTHRITTRTAPSRRLEACSGWSGTCGRWKTIPASEACGIPCEPRCRTSGWLARAVSRASSLWSSLTSTRSSSTWLMVAASRPSWCGALSMTSGRSWSGHGRITQPRERSPPGSSTGCSGQITGRPGARVLCWHSLPRRRTQSSTSRTGSRRAPLWASHGTSTPGACSPRSTRRCRRRGRQMLSGRSRPLEAATSPSRTWARWPRQNYSGPSTPASLSSWGRRGQEEVREHRSLEARMHRQGQARWVEEGSDRR